MSHAVIELVSPNGVPVSLHVTKDDNHEEIIATLERADKIGSYFAKQGWGFASTLPTGPSASELDGGPTFCGYRCSPTVDSRGLPSWIVVDGQQAMRREKQGDVWYSAKQADGTFEQVLKIAKGETVPPVKGL